MRHLAEQPRPDGSTPTDSEVTDVATAKQPAELRLMRAALDATERGWYVFPLHVRRKIPSLRRDWENVSTRDPDTIWNWWSHAPFNVGIATGRSGLVVIDLDTGKGDPPAEWAADRVTHGRDVLHILAERAGQQTPLDTFTVATPSGGLHLYFAAPAGLDLRNTTGKLGWRIDTRAHGGQVVGPESIVNGRRYTITRDVQPAPLPTWLIERLRPPVQAPVPATHVLEGFRADAYVQSAVRGECERVVHAAVGARNHAVFVAAAKLGGLVAGGALPEAQARQALEAASSHHVGVHGFTHEEALKTIESGLRRGAQTPRTPAARRPQRGQTMTAQRPSVPTSRTSRPNQLGNGPTL